MNIFNFDLFNNTEQNDSETFQSSFPLFNFDALKDITFDAPTFNRIPSQRVSEVVEDILYKKVRTNEPNAPVIKKRGRKPIAKNTRQWNDPEATLIEIIENDLAGEPTQDDIKRKEERLRKMRETKAKKRAQKNKALTYDDQTETSALVPLVQASFTPVVQPLLQTPQIVFRDGKLVVEAPLAQVETPALQLAETKRSTRLTSMSFRTKNHTAKWTEDETRKFYKSLEIFGADFSLIAKLFPTRNRDQLKNKFNKEEKTNSKKIDDAFKRNKVLGKRSIMDRIRNFNRILESQEEINPALEAETNSLSKLERNFSNMSSDSMDYKIMEEIQDIFVKEIRPKNALIAPFGTFGTTIEEPVNVDRFFELRDSKEQSQVLPIAAETREEAISKSENLLLRFIV